MLSSIPDKIKIFDVVYDIHMCERDSNFLKKVESSEDDEEIVTYKTEAVDFEYGHIYLLEDRKKELMYRSLWKCIFIVTTKLFHVLPLVELEENRQEALLNQLAFSINCLISDNEWQLNQETWKIMDTDFKVNWCQFMDQIKKDERVLGLTSFTDSIIWVYKDGRNDQDLWQTLLHETMHVIIEKLPLKELSDLANTNDQELFIDQIAVIINKVIQNNDFLITK